MATPKPTMRTLMVETGKGRFKVTIPSTWKVTYGPFNPGSRDGYSRTDALRIYEARDKQRACFRDVTGFYDLGIPISREKVSKQGERTWTENDDGFTNAESVKIEREWNDED